MAIEELPELPPVDPDDPGMGEPEAPVDPPPVTDPIDPAPGD